MAKFSKQHYEEVARVLGQSQAAAERIGQSQAFGVLQVGNRLVHLFTDDNDLFDEDRFRAAWGEARVVAAAKGWFDRD